MSDSSVKRAMYTMLMLSAFGAQAQGVSDWLTGGYVSFNPGVGQAKVNASYAALLASGASAKQSAMGFTIGAKWAEQTYLEYAFQRGRSAVNQSFASSPGLDFVKGNQVISTHAFSVVYRVPFGDRFSVDLKTGLAFKSQQFQVTSENASPYGTIAGTARSTVKDDSTGLIWGLAARYALTQRWSLVFGYLDLGKVGKYTGPQTPATATTPPKTAVASQTLSLAYTF